MELDDHYRGLKEHLSSLRVHDHACLAYDDREQQVTAIAHYLKTGLKRGEKCLYVSDKVNSDFVLRVLKDTGLDVDALVKKGALAVATPEEMYLRKGYFDPEDVIALGKALVAQTLAEGYTALRTASDMSWAKKSKLSSQVMVEWETKVSCLFNESMVSICQYNTNSFDKEMITEVLNSHPVSIFGGSIVRNQDIPATGSAAELAIQ